ncbi:MAG TPA: Ig-like domain-containing protein, partial [Vicinamibacterales bacterium]|nr:Ig-like domain-containing protein [Vicinamibacterales bacterium]
IGSDASSSYNIKYNISWRNLKAGTYVLTAVARDNKGGSTISAPRTLKVGSSTSTPTNSPPSVSMTAPASGATFTAPATITLSASASDTNGTIARVEFYSGTTRIGTDTSSPYSMSWPSVAAGSYTLKAVATDNAGAKTSSATRTITVRAPSSTPPPSTNQPPSVSLTSPAAGASFIAPATISLSATASDTGGSIARVEFYRGTTRIASDTTSPYTYSWTNVAAGTYAIKAVAYDNAGAMTQSSTRDITVRSATMPTTAVFTPSSNHSTAVDRYVIEIFTAGANTRVANPVATRDIGKPSITSGAIRADISSTIQGLSPGNYVATVTAFGDGGSSQSAASPQFTR